MEAFISVLKFPGQEYMAVASAYSQSVLEASKVVTATSHDHLRPLQHTTTLGRFQIKTPYGLKSCVTLLTSYFCIAICVAGAAYRITRIKNEVPACWIERKTFEL